MINICLNYLFIKVKTNYLSFIVFILILHELKHDFTVYELQYLI